jgi:hypothetical protein
MRLRRTNPDRVQVCETCGQACDGGCRAENHRDRARTRAAAALGLPR